MAFILNVVLARILLPEDFGSVALISSFLAILQVLGELGISVAIVQKKDLTQTTLHSAFWMTVSTTLFVSMAIFLAAPGISVFYSNGELNGLFKVSAFSYLFRGLYAFFNCLLLRSMFYRKIATIRFAGVLASGVLSIFLAVNGFGAFSLVWGQVASAAIMLLLAWSQTRYTPQFRLDFSEVWHLLSFGLWVSINRLLNNIAGKVDAMIIGKFIGAAQLGQYFLAQRLVLVLPSLVSGAMDQVLLPAYSRLQDHSEKIERAYWDSLVISLFFTLPPVCLIFLLSEELIFIIYGSKWLTIAPLMRIMSIFAFAGCFGGGIFGSILYSQSKLKAMTVVSIFRFVTLPLCLLAGSKWGVIGVAWGFAIYGIIGRLFNQLILKFSLSFSFATFIKKITGALLASVLATVCAELVLKYYGAPSSIAVFYSIKNCFLGSLLWLLIFYVLVGLIFYRRYFAEMRKIIFAKR